MLVITVSHSGPFKCLMPLLIDCSSFLIKKLVLKDLMQEGKEEKVLACAPVATLTTAYK